MSNAITERYFVQKNFADHADRALAAIVRKTRFRPEREIFRGQIYDKDKVGSVLYKGTWKKQPAVLKIQGLRPEVDEIDIIHKFNAQNTSTKIRLPHLYDGSPWNIKDGFGYLLLEYIDAPKIYQPPFATPAQRTEFCSLYEEYKTRCLHRPLFAQKLNEQSSLVFIAQRISHWVNVAESQGNLANDDIQKVEQFLTLIGRHLPSVKMRFLHGHFTYDDIFKLSDNGYVIMSNLFWSYRPEYYDATFHLWAGIKSLRDKNISIQKVQHYLTDWTKAYKKIPIIARDHDFDRKFNIMMAERCLGALLLDIQNQHYTTDRKGQTKHLRSLFQILFRHCTKKLE